MKRIGFWIAGAFLALHGLVEIFGLLLLNSGAFGSQGFIFIELQDNAPLVCMLGVIFGAVRIVAAAGIFMNRKWGLALGILISTVTFVIMTFYLPMGIADGILSGIVLVSSLMAYFGKRPIIET